MRLSRCYFVMALLVFSILPMGGALSPAQALQMTYELTGVTFEDGATATGSFDIDSSTGFFPTNVNIITSTSLTFTGLTSYDQGGILNPINVPNGYHFANASFPGYFLYFQFDTNLSTLPTSANLLINPTGFSLEENPPFSRYISSGNVTARSTAVPEPASWLLLGIGVATATFWRRRFSFGTGA